MAETHDPEPIQQTKPAKGKPVTIPVPKRGDVMAFLEKAAKVPDPDRDPSTGEPSQTSSRLV